MLPDSLTPPSACFRAIIAFMFLINLSVGSTHAQLPECLPADGLVGWWPFNGNANDQSGNGNDGAVTNAVLTEDRNGIPDAAYSFNGNAFIDIGNSEDLRRYQSDYSISAWILPNEFSSIFDQSIVSNRTSNPSCGSKFGIGGAYNSNMLGKLVLVNRGGVTSIYGATDTQVALSEFQHVAIAYEQGQDQSVVKLYINGVVSNTDTLVNDTCDPLNQTTYIGFEPPNGSPSASSFHFNGKIDDLAIYNRALTPEEVTALYTGVPYVAPCGDTAACNFNEEGDCVYAELNLDCDGNCLNDCNGNGVCDEDEVFGCSYPTACNYNAEATSDDGSCLFPDFGYNCVGNCLIDLNNNCLCDLEEVVGCTAIDAVNYNENATLDDGSCIITCKGDFDNDGQVTSSDLLSFLAAFGLPCSDGE